MARRAVRIVLLVLAAMWLVRVYHSDYALFEYPEQKTGHYVRKLSARLAERHQVALLLTFDEPRVHEWISAGPINYPGTTSGSGRFGRARYFDDDDDIVIETTTQWGQLGSEYTIGTWLNLDKASSHQEILYTYSHARQTGLALWDGRMTFHVPAAGEQQAISYAFDSYGEFVHVAGVADLSAGTAYLYEDGMLKASAPIARVEHPPHPIEFGKMRWYAGLNPLDGAVDDTVIWRRALSAEEVGEVARTSHSALHMLEPTYHRRWWVAKTLQRGIVNTLRVIDRFNPFLDETRVHRSELPEVSLFLSNGDLRHFNREHDRSLEAGRRVDEGRRSRRIHYVAGGRSREAQARLDGSNLRYPASPRPSYIIDVQGEDRILNVRNIRLTPPENMDWQMALAETRAARSWNLPHVENGLCRLVINGQFKGVYYYEDFSRRGMFPGNAVDMAGGTGSPADWGALFREGGGSEPFHRSPLYHADPAPVARLLAMYDEVDTLYRPLVANDLFQPLSNRELAYAFKTRRAEWAGRLADAPEKSALRAIADVLSPFAVLGDNPSPHYIVEDLKLVEAPDGLEIRWHSDRPDVIAHDGRVTRPAGDRPVRVEMTASWSDGDETETRSFELRVMPEALKLAAFMLNIDESLRLTRRADVMVGYHPAGGGPTRTLQGRIKHRGNTSFWRGRKKPFSLRTVEPHYLMGDTETRHLYLLNGYLDATRLKNKLSYDLFRAFSRTGAPRHAPEIEWAEVFVNGSYHGIYEMCTRVHAPMIGFVREDDDEYRPLLYKITAPDNLFRVIHDSVFDQKLPPIRYGPHFGPFRELTTFTSTASTEVFARRIDEWIDLRNAVDFLILLNFAENADGRTTNFYLARDDEPGARFFFIPWDYDRTFEGSRRWFSNYLFDRLWREYPGFPERVAARWSELREGVLAESALMERIGRMEQQLAGYMEREYEFLGFPEDVTHADEVDRLRANIRQRLAYLDERLMGSENPDG